MRFFVLLDLSLGLHDRKTGWNAKIKWKIDIENANNPNFAIFLYTPEPDAILKKFSLSEKLCNVTYIFRIESSGAIKIRFLDENRLEICNFQQFRQFRLFRSNLSDAIFQPIFKISKNRLADLIFPMLTTKYWLG